MTTPEAIGQLVMIEIVYGISLFFGVGEVVTGLIIIAGVIFVGEVVLDILESLVAFVTTAKDATTQTQLTAAAKHFAHALTLGLAIVAALLLRKAVRRLPIQTSMTPRPGMTVIRRGGSGGGGKRKLLAAEVKPVEPVPPKRPGKPKKLEAGTPEHKAQRWEDYKKKGGKYDYDKWSKQYDTNMRNTKVGLGREAEYRDAMGGVSETVKTPYTNRQIDVSVRDTDYMGQVKTGKVSLTEQAKIDIQKDAFLVKRGKTVEYILEKGASKPFLKALDDNGIKYKIGPQIPK